MKKRCIGDRSALKGVPWRNPRLVVLAGTAIAVIVLVLGGAASSAAVMASTAKYANPPGAVKLAKGKVRRVGNVVCGKPKSEWTPGSLLPSGYFISDARQASNYKALAARAKGNTKTRDLALAKTYTDRVNARRPTCSHLDDPPGAVNLAKTKVIRPGLIVCGKLGANWTPGTLLRSGWFISDSNQARNHQALAKSAKGKTKARYLASAKTYTHRAARNEHTCTKAGAMIVSITSPGNQSGTVGTPVNLQIHATASNGGTLSYSATGLPASLSIFAASGRITGTPTQALSTWVTITAKESTGSSDHVSFAWNINSSGAGATAAPLRFNLSGAIGLALVSTSGMTNGYAARLRPHAAMTAMTAMTGSNLDTLSATGQLADAVTSGSATVSHFLMAPNGKLYVLFTTRVDLADTSTPAYSTGCLLAQVDLTSGVPACVDSSLSSISWSGYGPGRPIQFDNNGAIYYAGIDTIGQTILRKYAHGVSTDLITDNVGLGEFLVLGDGTVFVSGTTSSTGAPWTRRISPTGSLQTLMTAAASFLLAFPDSNVYMGYWTNGTGAPVVGRYLTSSNQLDPRGWISGSNPYNDFSAACAAAHQDWYSNSFCADEWPAVTWSYRASDGRVYVVTGRANQTGPSIVQYYPTVTIPTTEVTHVTVAQGVITNLVLAGQNATGQNVLTLYNTTSDTETELIGPSNEIEIYHLNYASNGNKILFDGLRFADNRYVIGEYDLSTNRLNVVATSAIKWSDLQSF